MSSSSSSMKSLGKKLSRLDVVGGQQKKAKVNRDYLDDDKAFLKKMSAALIYSGPVEIVPPTDEEKAFFELPFRVNNVLYLDCPFKVTKLKPLRNNVTRISAAGQHPCRDTKLQLDLNTETYPLCIGDKFTLILTPIPNPDGVPHSGYWSPVTEINYSRYDFEYEMSGILSKIIITGPPDLKETYPFHDPIQLMAVASFGTSADEGSVVMRMKNVPYARLWEGQSLSLLIKKA